MKKIVRLTEGQLYRLIKDTLNNMNGNSNNIVNFTMNHNGKGKYRNTNESLVRRITENTLRLIKEQNEGNNWTCNYLRNSEGFYVIKGKWTDYSVEELTSIFEEMIVFQINIVNQNDAFEYLDYHGVAPTYISVISEEDGNINDFKEYPLYMEICYEENTGSEDDYDEDGSRMWSCVLSEFCPEHNRIDIDFPDGDNDPRTELVANATKNINWEKLKNSIEDGECEQSYYGWFDKNKLRII